MGATSRTKGAAGEREVAAMLFDELGLRFSRDLRQTQQRELGDLVCEDAAFPFTLEVKRYASGWDCRDAWEAQAQTAAHKAGKHPAVAFRFDRQEWRVRIWTDALAEALGAFCAASTAPHLDMSLEGFAWVCRELMAGRKAQ